MTLFEFSILDWIQSNLRTGLGDVWMPLITKLGNGGLCWIVLAVVLLLIPKTRKLGVAVSVSLALEVILCNGILKPLMARVRPCDVNTAVGLLIAHPRDFSFPSGHAMAAFTSASALYFSHSKLWIPTAVLAVLIALSRLYLYVHYPSDVLAGAILGIMLGALGATITRFYLKKRQDSEIEK